MTQNRKSQRATRRGRVLLVDRHALMRHAAAGWINRCPNLEVCGMASGVAQAFRAVQHLRPDVVVSEILRPRDLGFIRELHRRQPRLPILVFTLQEKACFGEQAEEAGASGYLMKEAGGDKLVQGVNAVLRAKAPVDGRRPKRSAASGT